VSRTESSNQQSAEAPSFTILLAHGSSDQEWSTTFEKMTAAACTNHRNVSVAYMELSTPSMDDIIRKAAATGFKNITIIPLFLASGKHLKLDIPQKLDKLKDELNINYKLLPAIGEHPMMSFAIKEIVSEIVNVPQQSDI
jgi:sirohydrochlorin cobaltochelatase